MRKSTRSNHFSEIQDEDNELQNYSNMRYSVEDESRSSAVKRNGNDAIFSVKNRYLGSEDLHSS